MTIALKIVRRVLSVAAVAVLFSPSYASAACPGSYGGDSYDYEWAYDACEYEEPAYEEVVYEEYEEPVYEETYEEPVYEEYEEPVYEEAVYEVYEEVACGADDDSEDDDD